MLKISIPQLNDLYIPVFLNCWIVKRNLDFIFVSFFTSN